MVYNVCASVCGLATFWITYENRLYGNGFNNKGQLGIDKKYCHYIPILIPNLYNVIDVVSAKCYSLALCSNKTMNTYIIIIYLLRINNINKIIPNDIINLIKKFCLTIQVYSTSFSEYGGNGHGGYTTNDGTVKIIEKLKNKDIIKISVEL